MTHQEEQLHIARMAALLDGPVTIPISALPEAKSRIPERLRDHPLLQREICDER